MILALFEESWYFQVFIGARDFQVNREDRLLSNLGKTICRYSLLYNVHQNIAEISSSYSIYELRTYVSSITVLMINSIYFIYVAITSFRCKGEGFLAYSSHFSFTMQTFTSVFNLKKYSERQ